MQKPPRPCTQCGKPVKRGGKYAFHWRNMRPAAAHPLHKEDMTGNIGQGLEPVYLNVTRFARAASLPLWPIITR